MSVLYWNFKELGNAKSHIVIRDSCKTHKPIFFLGQAQPMAVSGSIPSSFWLKFRLKIDFD